MWRWFQRRRAFLCLRRCHAHGARRRRRATAASCHDRRQARRGASARLDRRASPTGPLPARHLLMRPFFHLARFAGEVGANSAPGRGCGCARSTLSGASRPRLSRKRARKPKYQQQPRLEVSAYAALRSLQLPRPHWTVRRSIIGTRPDRATQGGAACVGQRASSAWRRSSTIHCCRAVRSQSAPRCAGRRICARAVHRRAGARYSGEHCRSARPVQLHHAGHRRPRSGDRVAISTAGTSPGAGATAAPADRTAYPPSGWPARDDGRRGHSGSSPPLAQDLARRRRRAGAACSTGPRVAELWCLPATTPAVRTAMHQELRSDQNLYARQARP